MRPNLSVSRCPFCGDSKKKKMKRRFYFYQNTKSGSLADHLSVKCHNCGYTQPFGVFLRDYDSNMYKDYMLEQFKDNNTSKRKKSSLETFLYKPSENLSQRFGNSMPNSCVKLKSLDATHDAVIQMRNRLLPDWFFDQLWYTENFNDVIESLRPDIDINGYPEPRVIIPFYDQEKKLTMVQGRSLKKDSELRYISIKLDESVDKIYGLDRVDLSKPVYVVEGPIDSSFIDNCLATADSNLTNANKYSDNLILIHDNQYRNNELCKQINDVITKGYEIVLFPSTVKYKDINDMVVKGKMSTKDIFNLIEQNRFKGLSAKLRFQHLRKGV